MTIEAKAIGAGIVALAVLGAVWRMHSLASDLEQCEKDKTALQNTIVMQNDKIQELKDAGDKVRADLAAALRNQEELGKIREQTDRIWKTRIIEGKVKDCATAVQQIREQIK